MSARCFLIFVVFCGLNWAAEPGFDYAASYNKREVSIPMRDGIHLFTAVYTPKDTTHRYPFLMSRTPYSIGHYGPNKFANLGRELAQSGFIFVLQDVRGRYMSEGKFVEERPETDSSGRSNAIDESTDTYDTIEWLLHNVPNNNGKVGLKGISYSGFYTSTGLIHAHPALVAASPQAPMADLFHGDDAYHNGAFFLLSNFSFYTDFGPQRNPSVPADPPPFPYGTNDGYSFFLQRGPLKNLTGNVYWTDVKNHATYDEYWKSRNVPPHLRDVRPAVLIVGGWFDAEDLSGTLKTYRAIRDQSPQTDVRLVMGPWWHGGWARSSGSKIGELSFGSATGEFFRSQIELPFFVHYLKDGPDPNLPLAYVFETGKNVWCKESAWPPQRVVRQSLNLREGKRLSFERSSEPTTFDQYISDPSRPVPFFSKPVLETPKEYMVTDQRFVENRPDLLSYKTDALQHDLTIAGPVRPSLYVSTSGTDSDFVVKLIDVHPDGYEQLLRGEPFRGKFRNSSEQPEPFVPGEPTLIRFEMPDVYHCFGKGHRIMVQIQSSWFPLVDRNPQTFVNIPEANATDFVTATERIYRSGNTPSAIEVSVIPDGSNR